LFFFLVLHWIAAMFVLQPTNRYFVEMMDNDDWTLIVNEETGKPQVRAAGSTQLLLLQLVW
jgi:hypothetical protein